MSKIYILILILALLNIYKFSEEDEMVIDNTLEFGFEDEEEIYNNKNTNTINEMEIEEKEIYQGENLKNENIENIVIPEDDEEIPEPKKYRRIPKEELNNDIGKEQNEVKNQMEFIRDFACYLSVQKVLRNHESAFKQMAGNMNIKLALKKAVANIFITCKKNMTSEDQHKILMAKTAEEYEALDLEMLHNFDVNKFLEDPDPRLTNVENLMYDAYEKLEEEVSKMKNEFTNKTNQKSKQNREKYINKNPPKKTENKKTNTKKRNSGKKKENKKGNKKEKKKKGQYFQS